MWKWNWNLSVKAFAVGRRLRAWWRFRASLGNGLSEVDAFYNPKRRHAIELRVQDVLRREEDDDGGGADDGDGENDRTTGAAKYGQR